MGESILPFSRSAKKLCAAVLVAIVGQETRVRARRANDQETFELAVTLIVSDLMMALARGGGGWAYRSVSKKSFTDSVVKGDTFNSIVASLNALGLIEKVLGGNLQNPFATETSNSFSPGLATRFRGTAELISLSQGCGIELSKVKSHFKRKPSLRELRLKGMSSRSRGQKVNGRSLRVVESDATKSIRQRLAETNSFLIAQKYTGMDFYGLRRIFNEGDHSSFDWNLGGRLYGVGDDNYQMMKKADRSKIKINGNPVVELDINASYLRILHGLRGFALPKANDIYEIEGVNRSLVKAWIASTLGHTSFHRSWSLGVASELRKAGVEMGPDRTYPKLMPKVLEKFPVLADWPSCGVRWSSLMYQESEALMTTMEALRDLNIVALPVHDSLIVPKSDASVARRVMTETFEVRFGVPFVVRAS